MPRKRSNKGKRPLAEFNPPADVDQSRKLELTDQSQDARASVAKAKNLELNRASNDICPKPCSSANAINSDTAALYNELDNFRQRWKRELENKKQDLDTDPSTDSQSTKTHDLKAHNLTLKESFSSINRSSDNTQKVYALAKKLFLIGVNLEQDEMHHESIRYYKQAVHLCPDIEKQIFTEQCEASVRSANSKPSAALPADQTETDKADGEIDREERIPLVERIRQSHNNDSSSETFVYCKPATKVKSGSMHISQLPHELMLRICLYIVGEELDLASLECIGMVCRGFYLLSRDVSMWRSICNTTWGSSVVCQLSEDSQPLPDWRQFYIDTPRVNCDGVYISRTRYIRQGDVGFQDITYRPFHVVRYYRYLRFFPDHRVLILTTNEEPERIVPIFRQAVDSKHFSSELSILEGKYEFSSLNLMNIVAEKDCSGLVANNCQNPRRQAQFNWSRQTPIAQKFTFKFELKTVDSKPYRNNVLKWLDYTIITTLETGQEITTFDLSPDTFPNLMFSRVRRFNLRTSKPLDIKY